MLLRIIGVNCPVEQLLFSVLCLDRAGHTQQHHREKIRNLRGRAGGGEFQGDPTLMLKSSGHMIMRIVCWRDIISGWLGRAGWSHQVTGGVEGEGGEVTWRRLTASYLCWRIPAASSDTENQMKVVGGVLWCCWWCQAAVGGGEPADNQRTVLGAILRLCVGAGGHRVEPGEGQLTLGLGGCGWGRSPAGCLLQTTVSSADLDVLCRP